MEAALQCFDEMAYDLILFGFGTPFATVSTRISVTLGELPASRPFPLRSTIINEPALKDISRRIAKDDCNNLCEDSSGLQADVEERVPVSDQFYLMEENTYGNTIGLLEAGPLPTEDH